MTTSSSEADVRRVVSRHAMLECDDVFEARLLEVLGRWWLEERPAWTEGPWWQGTLRKEVRNLLWLPAGPLLTAALAQLDTGAGCSLPHTGEQMPGIPTPGHAPGWPCACQVVVAAAWEACAAWVAAGAARALVAAAGPHPVIFEVGGGQRQLHDPAREELAHALRATVNSTCNRINAARDLYAQPAVMALVESATISGWTGRLVVEHLADLTEDQANQVVTEVTARIQARLAAQRRPYNSAEVNRIARAARLRICPESEQEARVRAFAGRRVTVHHQSDGMSTLVAELAEADAHRIYRRLSSIATALQTDAVRDGQPEPRTRDQLRADVFADLLVGATPGRNPRVDGAAVTPSGPVATEIQVIVTLETLIGLTNDPAEVPGLGAIPAETARELAADGRWRAWITDASGIVTATGSCGYVPSAGLARLVRAREPRCRFPGCRQPAPRCDLDHAIPWPAGRTNPENLGPLCRRHHVLKTHGGWALEPHPPGWQWRSPAGFTINDQPGVPLGG